jgi:hypothetical protein
MGNEPSSSKLLQIGISQPPNKSERGDNALLHARRGEEGGGGAPLQRWGAVGTWQGEVDDYRGLLRIGACCK